MAEEKYIIFNFCDLTEESQKHLIFLGLEENVKNIQLKEGKKGYILNRRPI